ncbi:MAG TPA: hypothetical protein EYG03_23435 [Planctomycetes bacterium]|nr:hypothetical protein [Fuerstiella sp.]HIK94910.1 hypothetical protein [Planctomycetota bacterium]
MQQHSQNNRLRNATGYRPRVTDNRNSALAPQTDIQGQSQADVRDVSPSPADSTSGGWADQVRQLLVHFDAQEAAMLALNSLLQDMGTVGADGEEARRLRVRMDAATDLCRRLDSDCRLVVQQLAERMQIAPGEFVVRHLIAAVAEHDAEMAQALRTARRRLLQLTWQVRRTSSTTGWILAGYREIRHAVFQHTSGVTNSDRYDASGRKSVAPESLRYGARS